MSHCELLFGREGNFLTISCNITLTNYSGRSHKIANDSCHLFRNNIMDHVPSADVLHTEIKPEIGRDNMRKLVELASQGKLRPRISRRFPLEQAVDALQAVIDRKVIGKAVLIG
jgi:NADPH:quinone reductase-like Zn-dependent oxidoreductase